VPSFKNSQARTQRLRSTSVWRLFLPRAIAACSLLFATQAFAGGGPENVLLLVNANSESSKTVANHYIALRQIPATNVLYIDWKSL
jgi:hypothetical protein